MRNDASSLSIELYEKATFDEITQLFIDVFTDSEGETEGLMIGELVSDMQTSTNTEDIFGFIAKDQGNIVGAIFFTRMTFEVDINGFILSPVAIATNYQKQGIGQQLIRFGMAYLKNYGVTLLVTYGDPRFYSKVGFVAISEKVIRAPLKLSYPEGWLAQSLTEEVIVPIEGESYCVDALNNQRYW